MADAYSNIRVQATNLNLNQVRKDIQQSKIQRQQMDAARTALDYQKKQIEQAEKATNAAQIGQEYTAMQFQKALSPSNLINDDGSLSLEALVGGSFTPDKTEANYEEFAQLYKDKGLTPNPNLFMQTNEQLSLMESRNKLNELAEYKINQGLSDKEFNQLLRGDDNVGLGAVNNLLLQQGGDYNNFIQSTGFDPAFKGGFGEQALDFATSPLGSTLLTTAAFWIGPGKFLKGGKFILSKAGVPLLKRVIGAKNFAKLSKTATGLTAKGKKQVEEYFKNAKNKFAKEGKIVPPDPVQEQFKKTSTIKKAKEAVKKQKAKSKAPIDPLKRGAVKQKSKSRLSKKQKDNMSDKEFFKMVDKESLKLARKGIGTSVPYSQRTSKEEARKALEAALKIANKES